MLEKDPWSSMACLWNTQICVFPRLNALYRAISIVYIIIYIYIYICVCVSYIPRNPNKFHETSWCSSSQSVFISRFFRAVTCAAGAAARSQLPAADSQRVETARALVWRPTEGDDPSDPSFGGSYGWIMENHIDNYWDIDKMIYDIYIYILGRLFEYL